MWQYAAGQKPLTNLLFSAFTYNKYCYFHFFLYYCISVVCYVNQAIKL